MRKKINQYILLLSFIAFNSVSNAQESSGTTGYPIDGHYPNRFYLSSGLDLAVLSIAKLSNEGEETKFSTPRFNVFVNIGLNLNYDFNKGFGVFTGLNIRNIGFIEKVDGTTYKRRVYSLGIPLGLKFGNLWTRDFFFSGVGVDFPFHYKSRVFKERKEKKKDSEWFGDQTERILPFVFLGYSSKPGFTVKLQYYPTNFLNTEFSNESSTGISIKPFTGYNVNLILLSIGVDIHYGIYKIHEAEYQLLNKKKEKV
jgi:hypothetical protein